METQKARDFYRDKILQLDMPVAERFLKKYSSPWRILRPLFWWLFGFVARYLSARGAGLGFLATELAVPVVPVYIEGAFKALRPGTVFLKKVPVSVRFGQPVIPEKPGASEKASDVSEGFRTEIYQEFSNKIRDEILKLRERPKER